MRDFVSSVRENWRKLRMELLQHIVIMQPSLFKLVLLNYKCLHTLYWGIKYLKGGPNISESCGPGVQILRGSKYSVTVH